MTHLTRALSALATASLVILTALVPTTSASAATSAGWADWEPLTGSAGNWSTTMQLPAGGFPAASATSNSRGGVGVISGATSWLGEASPPGAVYGSSRNQQYLNLRPQADTPAAPSTTTYTFERPTPASGWAFVLGDIDADRAVISAIGPDGQSLTAEELGWQGGFNYCPGAGSPSCNGDDTPTWDPATGELIGNDAAADTNGASGWFRPTVPVTSLTVEFFQRSGFPVYQTWFASLARDITGTVTLVDDTGAPQGPLTEATLTLFGPDGTQLATTTSAEDGTYAFEGYTAAPGYRVEMTTLPPVSDEHPFGLVAQGPSLVDSVDLTDADATGVDFAARDIKPVAVSGTVLDDDGNPVAGATVTLTPAGGDPFTTATNAQGQYVIDGVAWDIDGNQPQEYAFSLSNLPEGYSPVSVPGNITVEVGQEDASTGNDFVVQAPSAVSGTVTAGGEPVAGIVVTLDGPDGPVTTTTAADGTYTFDGVLPGDHTVSIEVPDGHVTDGPVTQDVTVGGDDITGIDFALARLGRIAGTVTDDAGDPVPGATVTVEGPDGPVELTADEEGAYFAGDLPAGEYTITLTVPDGYSAETTERAVTITSAGESFLEENFAVIGLPVDPQLHQAGGTVADADGGPVPGTDITVTDADGQTVVTVTTGEDGTWVTDLFPGQYTATITPPDGYVVDGDATLAFEVVDQDVTGLDFLLAEESAVPSPSPSGDPTVPGPGDGTGGPGGTDPDASVPGAGGLAATGATVGATALGAVLLLSLGGLLVWTSRRARAGARTDV
ncbi:MSCRAMM family protein [Promicromonospora iranensis]|uniref:alpha-amylase n=1 Tax=Promicromonospora iranensis TaxID=1105144 RepID=A0ABU2CIP3_9MICO|nr:carboxypeptidase regulatory-like domain-containing protein [Promicromonospora iranensis]MDR7381196.1 hypothetical protein [Promicromonospora iranensis]